MGMQQKRVDSVGVMVEGKVGERSVRLSVSGGRGREGGGRRAKATEVLTLGQEKAKPARQELYPRPPDKAALVPSLARLIGADRRPVAGRRSRPSGRYGLSDAAGPSRELPPRSAPARPREVRWPCLGTKLFAQE
jgi:hypothetical protein